jgi:hypothetical protein
MFIDEFLNLAEIDFKLEGSYNRYPVRFISIKFNKETENNIIEMCKYIQKESPLNNCKIVDFQSWLNHDEGWFSVDIILKKIKSLKKDCNYIIIGLSEYIRFLSNSEFITLIKSLLEIENSSKYQERRIYFPCFALYGEIVKIVNYYHKRIDVYNPLLNEVISDQLQQLYFIKEGLDNTINENVIINTKQWFNMWRDSNINFNKPMICLSKTLSIFYYKASPDNVFNITVIATYEDLLSKLYNIRNIVPLKDHQKEFYNYLIKLMNNQVNKPVQQIILNAVNAVQITIENVIYIWKVSDELNKCLIKNYILLYFDEDTYLYSIMSKVETLDGDEFFKLIYTNIFNNFNLIYTEERRILISKIVEMDIYLDYSNHVFKYYCNFIEDIISRYLKSEEKFDIDIKNGSIIKTNNKVIEEISKEIIEKAIPIFTNSSICERRVLIWLYINRLIDNNIMKSVYPEFYSYINGNSLELLPLKQDKLHSYFCKYKKCRVNSLELNEYIIELEKWNNSEESFYKWYFDNNLEFSEMIVKKNNIEDNVVVFDGVGGEFLEYLIYLLNINGYHVEMCCYAKSHLPSTTEQARKFFSEKYKWYRDFDTKVIHGEMYYHISNLELSLRIIKEMVLGVIKENLGKRIAIIADHGATINHKLINSLKCYDYSNADHGGRCLKVLDDINNYGKSKDYIQYEDEFGGNWIISINEKSLYNSSPYEVHGGGTIEEIIVPMLISYPYSEKISVINYRVIPNKLIVSGIDKEVSFKILPKPKVPPIIKAIDGTDKNLIYNIDFDEWKNVLNTGKTQTIFIEVDKQKFEFETVTLNKMKGNDGFDD